MREELSSEASILSMRGELARKGIHLLPLSIPLVYSYNVLTYPTIVKMVAVITFVFSGLDLLRLRFDSLRRVFFWIFGGVIRKHEARFLTGSTFLLISFLFSLLVFSKPITVAVMYYTVLGDGVASLVGRKWGKRRIGRRTVEGSAACLLICLIIGMLVEGLGPSLVFVGALVATGIEGLSDRADDNMTIPLVTGVSMMGWEWGLRFWG